ncbi:MAG: hypothetical protein CVU84_13390 [Firmicutes bacterium HGW-Firmicutes-1]|nr:MAG: hypothetical protein CVU84_13390 [Firmicutes bacterium HGW-Firmicutes-1]
MHFQTGEAEGDLLPHVYPVGTLLWTEIPFGTMATKKLISIDPISKFPVFEDLPIVQTESERIEELENQLLMQADEMIGGIL